MIKSILLGQNSISSVHTLNKSEILVDYQGDTNNMKSPETHDWFFKILRVQFSFSGISNKEKCPDDFMGECSNPFTISFCVCTSDISTEYETRNNDVFSIDMFLKWSISLRLLSRIPFPLPPRYQPDALTRMSIWTKQLIPWDESYCKTNETKNSLRKWQFLYDANVRGWKPKSKYCETVHRSPKWHSSVLERFWEFFKSQEVSVNFWTNVQEISATVSYRSY